MASIVIPAHNEARVIAHTLSSVTDGLRPGTHIVVAANGCTDDTAAIARGFATQLPQGVSLDVLDLAQGSKQAALNAADELLGDDFPRVYLDADIAATATAMNDTIEALEKGAIAARPPLEYQTSQADALVGAYYRARTRTPQVMEALWGAGCFAVSAMGRSRWGAFPLDAPDDLFVDSLFTDVEKRIVDTDPVPVQVPRTAPALLRTLKRVHRRSDTTPQEHGTVQASGSTLKALLRSNNTSIPARLDAAAYVALSVAARVAIKLDRGTTGHSGDAWERDDTTR